MSVSYFLVFWCVIAIATVALARSKGRSGLLWFLLAIPFNFFALLLLVLLPSTNVPEEFRAASSGEAIPRKVRTTSESIGYRAGRAWSNSSGIMKIFLGLLILGVIWGISQAPHSEKKTTEPSTVESEKSAEVAAAPKTAAQLAQDASNEKKRIAQEERDRIVREKADAKRRRSEGVSIGMSREDVLASKWGKPHSINTTTTRYGVHEQWAYGGHNYLYFDNGRLTTIQN